MAELFGKGVVHKISETRDILAENEFQPGLIEVVEVSYSVERQKLAGEMKRSGRNGPLEQTKIAGFLGKVQKILAILHGRRGALDLKLALSPAFGHRDVSGVRVTRARGKSSCNVGGAHSSAEHTFGFRHCEQLSERGASRQMIEAARTRHNRLLRREPFV